MNHNLYLLLKIVLEHPCLILPRNSLSNERIVADLGMIDLQNVLDAEQNDYEEQVQKWQIRFTKMKLETLSENGNSSVITHNVDGFATISSIKQATMTSFFGKKPKEENGSKFPGWGKTPAEEDDPTLDDLRAKARAAQENTANDEAIARSLEED